MLSAIQLVADSRDEDLSHHTSVTIRDVEDLGRFSVNEITTSVGRLSHNFRTIAAMLYSIRAEYDFDAALPEDIVERTFVAACMLVDDGQVSVGIAPMAAERASVTYVVSITTKDFKEAVRLQKAMDDIQHIASCCALMHPSASAPTIVSKSLCDVEIQAGTSQSTALGTGTWRIDGSDLLARDHKVDHWIVQVANDALEMFLLPTCCRCRNARSM